MTSQFDDPFPREFESVHAKFAAHFGRTRLEHAWRTPEPRREEAKRGQKIERRKRARTTTALGGARESKIKSNSSEFSKGVRQKTAAFPSKFAPNSPRNINESAARDAGDLVVSTPLRSAPHHHRHQAARFTPPLRVAFSVHCYARRGSHPSSSSSASKPPLRPRRRRHRHRHRRARSGARRGGVGALARRRGRGPRRAPAPAAASPPFPAGLIDHSSDFRGSCLFFPSLPWILPSSLVAFGAVGSFG